MSPATAPSPASVQTTPRPRAPVDLRDTGLTADEVSDLVLKTLFRQGAREGTRIADFLALPYPVLDDLILSLQQRHLLEVVHTRGHGRGGYTFSLTEEGRARARQALDSSRYVGPAPVPLDDFRSWLGRQSVRNISVDRERLTRAFDDLVLSDDVYDALGPAVNSGSSIFLHGAPGNGKTALAERLGSLVSDEIYLPRALVVDGHIVVLVDPIYHGPVESGPRPDDLVLEEEPRDRRYARVARPTVMVGGELTLDELDLRWDPYARSYHAPFQLKAAGGVLLMDDFGRQRVGPAALLNRWIVPLEKGFDTLTLHSGVRFSVPFDCLLVFATNLNPRDLVDESFLRRIQFKVEIRSPDRAAFRQILAMECDAREIPFDPAAVDLLYDEYYDAMGFPPRGCHPRDLLHQIESIAAFEDTRPALDPELLRRAARSYFLVMEEEYTEGIPSLERRTPS